MILRAIAICLVLSIGVGAIIPFTADSAQAVSPKSKSYKKKYKKYSKRWWRAYRMRVRKMKALQARKRMLRLRRIRLAEALKIPTRMVSQNVAATVPAIQTGSLFILVQGKVTKVFDGDTFTVESKDGKVYQVRMLGVDAPEISQNFGDLSRKKLSDLILGKDATVIIRKKDTAERYVGTIYCDGQDINLKQIETGMARNFQQSGYEPMKSDRETYKQAEQKAQIERKGLWRRQKLNHALALKR